MSNNNTLFWSLSRTIDITLPPPGPAAGSFLIRSSRSFVRRLVACNEIPILSVSWSLTYSASVPPPPAALEPPDGRSPACMSSFNTRWTSSRDFWVIRYSSVSLSSSADIPRLIIFVSNKVSITPLHNSIFSVFSNKSSRSVLFPTMSSRIFHLSERYPLTHKSLEHVVYNSRIWHRL